MAGEDPEYLSFVRALPCCAPDAPNGCLGAVEPHHDDRHGMSQRAHDRTAIPMCHGHHIFQWHAGAGVFKDWTRDQRRDWLDIQIALTLAKFNRVPEFGCSIPF